MKCKKYEDDKVIILPEHIDGIVSSQAIYSPLYYDSPLWNIALIGSLNQNNGRFRMVHIDNLEIKK